MTNLGIEQSTFGMVASNHLENMLVNWDHHPFLGLEQLMMQPSASLHQDAVYLDPQSAHENWYYNGLVNIRKHLGGIKTFVPFCSTQNSW